MKKNILATYLNLTSNGGTNLLIALIIPLTFGLDVYGQYVALLSISAILGTFFSSRTNEATVKFYGHEIGSENRRSQTLLFGTLIDILLGLLLFIVVFFLSELIAESLLKNNTLQQTAKNFGFFIFLNFIFSTPIGYLISEKKFILYAVISIATNTFKLLLIVGSYFILNLNTIDAIVYCLIISNIFYAIFYLYLLAKNLLRYLNLTIERDFLWKYFLYSIKTFASLTIKSGNREFDKLALGIYYDPNILGTYGLLKQFFTPMNYISAPFSINLFPEFVSDNRDSKINNIRKNIHKVNRKILSLSILVIPLCITFLILYTSSINVNLSLESYLVIFFLAFTSLISSISWWTRPFSSATNPIISLISNSFATIVIIISVFPLARSFGMIGVTMLILIVNIAVYIYFSHALNKMLKRKL